MLHRSVWFVKSLEKLYTGRVGGGDRSFLRVVHSRFLMSVFVFLLVTSTQDIKKKKTSSSSSLMHCHYNISTWKAHDPQISRHWTKTQYKSLLFWCRRDELRTETEYKMKTLEAPDGRRQITSARLLRSLLSLSLSFSKIS